MLAGLQDGYDAMQCSIVLRILVVHRQISRPKQMLRIQCCFKIMEKWKWSSCQQKKPLLGMFVPAVILTLHWNWCPLFKINSFLRGSPDVSKSTLLRTILNFELQEGTFFTEGKISRSSWRGQRRSLWIGWEVRQYKSATVERWFMLFSRILLILQFECWGFGILSELLATLNLQRSLWIVPLSTSLWLHNCISFRFIPFFLWFNFKQSVE